MGSIYRHIDSVTDAINLDRINEILDAYGVDYVHNSTFLGEGAYKEVHRTNIEGVAMMITGASDQIEREMFILDLLALDGYPMMEYYAVEKIGHVTLALAKLLLPPDRSWDEDRVEGLRKEVEFYLERMIDEKISIGDLQFLVDEDGKLVFTDPLNLSEGERWSCREAYCKDDKTNPGITYVRVSKRG